MFSYENGRCLRYRMSGKRITKYTGSTRMSMQRCTHTRSETSFVFVFEQTNCHSYGYLRMFSLLKITVGERNGNQLKTDRGNHLTSQLFILQRAVWSSTSMKRKGLPRILPLSLLSVFLYRLICPAAV